MARLALHVSKDQGAVWQGVAMEQMALHHSLSFDVCDADSPTSLQLTYEHGGVQRAIEEYTQIIGEAPAAADAPAVGVVWAINGMLSHADRYANEKLFAKLWQKLLRSAATDAVAQRHLTADGPCDGPSSPAPLGIAIDEVQTWLAGRADDDAARAEEEQLPPRTRLRSLRGRTQHRFEAFDTAWDAAGPLHVAVLAE